MKNLKYRGKNLKGKWVYGLPIRISYSHVDDDWNWGIQIVDDKSCCDVHTVYPKTIGQYTGRKDISNIDMFSGDIVESQSGTIYLVDFRYSAFVLVHKPTCGSEREGECKYDYLHVAIDTGSELEKIGNIHDNPELLEG